MNRHQRQQISQRKQQTKMQAGQQAADALDREIRFMFAQDAYANQAARLGWNAENLTESAEYPMTRLTLNYMLLLSLYRSNGILRRIVNKPAEDACAHWLKVDSQLTPDQLDALDRLQRQTDLKHSIETGIKWARLFGGAAGLILIDGQGDMLDQPLDMQTVEPGSFKGIYVVDRWSGIYPDVGTIDDINSPDFGMPEYYQVRTDEDATNVMRVHYSRIVRFMGDELPYWERLMEMSWGSSVIETIYDELKMYDNTKFNIANLIFQANVWIQKSDNLEPMLAAAPRQAQERLWNTIHAQQTLMSNFNTRVIGKNDDLQNHQYTFSGLSDVFEVFMYALSAVSGIPVTLLFGRSPAGENATGDADLENYYTLCEGIQETKIRPAVEQLLPIMCMSEFGAVPDDLNVRFNPVHNATDKENSDLAQKLTTSVNESFTAGIISEQQAMKEYRSISDMTNGSLWSNVTDKDVKKAGNAPNVGDVPDIGASEKPQPASQKDGMALDSDRWITIHGGENAYGESTGRHVEIDEHGNIVGGSIPKSAQGKNIRNWWKSDQPNKSAEIEGLIQKYRISYVSEGPNKGKIAVYNMPKGKDEVDKLKSLSPEIKKYFSEKEEKYKEQERQERIKLTKNVPGLSRLDNAYSAQEAYEDRLRQAISHGYNRMPEKPRENVAELSKQYPVAAAYLQARGYSNASNDLKAAAGRKAMNRLKNGEDYQTVLNDMESEWSKGALERAWE